MEWAEESEEMLKKLIEKSGIKISTSAKYAAVRDIIKLIDENSLDGLLESIRHDYERAKSFLTSEADYKARALKAAAACSSAEREHRSAEKTLAILREEIRSANKEWNDLREQIDKLKAEGQMLEMQPEERSRILAYQTALDIGKKFAEGNRVDMTQVMRSASNVVGGFAVSQKQKSNASDE